MRKFKDLYVNSDYFPTDGILTKQAMHKMPPNILEWPIAILKVLGEDYGWVTEGIRPASVDIEKVDKNTGSGFGGIVVWANPPGNKQPGRSGMEPEPKGQNIMIPFVVRNFQMSPLDIFVSGKKVAPLTPKRITEELMVNDMFTGVDKSYSPQLSILNKLSPPPDAFYSRYGMTQDASMAHYGTAGSPADSLILNQLVSTLSPEEMKTFRNTIYSDPSTLAQFVRNNNVDLLRRIVGGREVTPDDEKNFLADGLPKNVILFVKDAPGLWTIKMYNDFSSTPVIEKSVPEQAILETFAGMEEVTQKIWESDSFLVTIDHRTISPVVWHDKLVPETQPISAPGVYLVVTKDKTVERGFAWKGFLDYEMNPKDYVLWYDGNSWSVQETVQAEMLDEDWEFEEGTLKDGIWGTFLLTNEDGEQEPVMPFKIVAIYHGDGRVYVRATDIFGHDVNFILDPGVDNWVPSTGVLSSSLGSALSARGYFVPSTAQFVTLGSQRIALMEDALNVDTAMRNVAISSLSLMRDKTLPASTLALTHQGDEKFRLEGAILEPLFSSNVSETDGIAAKWALVMLGCSIEDAEAILDSTIENHQTVVMGLIPIKSEIDVQVDAATGEVTKISKILRKNLIKEAAYIKDKGSVDALLSLNFISPQNLIVFLQNIDKFQEVESHLAKLLLMTRFGLDAVPESAVANALKNLNRVTESLEMLEGVLGNEMSPEGDLVTPEEEQVPVPSTDTTMG